METLKFNTITDVQTWFDNSGYKDWEWFEGFKESDLINCLWVHAYGKYTGKEMIQNFLVWKGQNPKHYGF